MSSGRSRVLLPAVLTALALSYAACGVPSTEERGRPACFDGEDNDGDGLTDCDDPYCKIVCEEICTDSVDNDGDGFNGCEDPKCAGKQCFTPGEICGNGVDDDKNDLSDCDDPACAEVKACIPTPVEICDNGRDDDQNGAYDCADPACELAPNCEQCDNGIDDDQDSLTDCEDPVCRAACGLIERCTGGVDEDQDGAIDCADTECRLHEACISGCRVRGSGVGPYSDSCRDGYICTCAGAPGCPTEDPNEIDLIGDLVGVTELCQPPQTCEDGGGCRELPGTYTVKLFHAGMPVDDLFNEPELYVEVNGTRISDIENEFEFDCDDCYTLITWPETDSLTVSLWDYDSFPNPIPDLPDIVHSDLIVSCTIELDEEALKDRGLRCAGNGVVDLTIEPHTGP